MASFRRAAFDASKFLKQGTSIVRKCSKTVLNAQARTLMIQQSALLKRSSVELVVAKQAQKFSSIPRITSALLSTIPAIDNGVVQNGESGSSEVLEGSGSDEEGLVTPAREPLDDL
ncbi:uncharacterized protein LOC116301257 [Actinia tenebrosa]|uniref:Uncharacterized protein LOC116301257 n=1 Tax=Actinia tenebrosa TaxID=6105 RepID=A0A6P8IHK6_ACTTE|nr:uncharacterized protein LOC116301257 [Actinia tenebrosa]